MLRVTNAEFHCKPFKPNVIMLLSVIAPKKLWCIFMTSLSSLIKCYNQVYQAYLEVVTKVKCCENDP
jgi:hypothetical protein